MSFDAEGGPPFTAHHVNCSCHLWIIGAAPAGRALRHSSERPGRADRTHAPAHEQAHGSALPMVLGGAHSPRRSFCFCSDHLARLASDRRSAGLPPYTVAIGEGVRLTV